MRSDNLNAAIFMMGSMAAFTVNDSFMKMMSGEVPLFQILFLRGVMTSIAIGLIAWRMGLFKARPPRRDWLLIVLRSVADVATAYFFLTALFNMPLANITAILQAVPLVITLAAWVFLGETVGWRRLLAIGVGLIGVMLIIRPGAADFTIYSVYGLAAICGITLRDLSTRKLSAQTPSFLVTFVTSLTIMMVFGGFSLPETWSPMSARHWGLTTAAAATVILAYLFSILVMRRGEIGFVAPFRYTGPDLGADSGVSVFRRLARPADPAWGRNRGGQRAFHALPGGTSGPKGPSRDHPRKTPLIRCRFALNIGYSGSQDRNPTGPDTRDRPQRP